MTKPGKPKGSRYPIQLATYLRPEDAAKIEKLTESAEISTAQYIRKLIEKDLEQRNFIPPDPGDPENDTFFEVAENSPLTKSGG